MSDQCSNPILDSYAAVCPDQCCNPVTTHASLFPSNLPRLPMFRSILPSRSQLTVTRCHVSLSPTTHLQVSLQSRLVHPNSVFFQSGT